MYDHGLHPTDPVVGDLEDWAIRCRLVAEPLAGGLWPDELSDLSSWRDAHDRQLGEMQAHFAYPPLMPSSPETMRATSIELWVNSNRRLRNLSPIIRTTSMDDEHKPFESAPVIVEALVPSDGAGVNPTVPSESVP